MKAALPITAARKLWPVIRMLDREQYAEVRAELCRLSGYAGTPTTTHAVVVPEPPAPIARPAIAVARDAAPVVSLPKPEGRIVDVPLLDRFAAAHPWCWARGCGRRANRPHHLRKRSDGGSDIWSNLFAACDDGPENHHTGNLSWHTIEPYGAGFYVCFAARLEREHRELIVAALPEIEAQVLGIVRREIQIYPAAARALIAA